MAAGRLDWKLGLLLACALVGCDSGSSGGDTDTDSDGGSGGSTVAETNDTASTNPSGSPTSGESATSTTDATDGTTSSADGSTTRDDTDDTGNALPPGSGCCEAHAGGGCNEAPVELCVCEAAPNCCVFDWTQECADIAQDNCAATCEGGSDTDTDTDTTDSDTDVTDSGTSMCDDTVLELGAMDADLSGAWEYGMSQSGEGQIIVLGGGGGAAGTISFDVDIPCEDQWFIWVRYFEQQSDDSFYATLDGEPNPAGVFEGDCTPQGGGWDWALLNYRTENDALCDYVEDPWAPDWDEGSHNISFAYRESQALARIVVTNDPNYTP